MSARDGREFEQVIMRWPTIAVLTVALAGCSGKGEVQVPVEPALKWEALADGSKFAVGPTDPAGSGALTLIRCWAAEPAYDCIAISGEDWRDVRRTIPTQMPTTIWAAQRPPGYDCSIGSVGFGYQEHISNKLGQLTEHVESGLLGRPGPGWTKDYVDRYVAANQITPEAVWFDCRAMTVAVQAGSNATIASTSVSRAMLDGKAAVQ